MKERCFRLRFCTARLCWARDNLGNEMSFVMNHAPGAGSFIQATTKEVTTSEISWTIYFAPYYTYVTHWAGKL